MIYFSNCLEDWKMKPYLYVNNPFIQNSLKEFLISDQMERKPNYRSKDKRMDFYKEYRNQTRTTNSLCHVH